jgi:hypothetical protein
MFDYGLIRTLLDEPILGNVENLCYLALLEVMFLDLLLSTILTRLKVVDDLLASVILDLSILPLLELIFGHG